MEILAGRARARGRDKLGLIYKAAIAAYIFTVVILSYREGMTVFAKGAAIVLAGLFVFRAATSGEKIFFPIEFRLLFAWFMVGLVSSALSQESATALVRVITLLQVYPIAFIIANLLYWNGDTRFYWLTLVVAGVASGLITLSDPMRFSGEDGRIFGTLANANAFAALLAVAVAVCLGAITGTTNVILRLGGLALAGFFLYLVARTGSRMGMLASVGAAVVVMLCFRASRRGRGATRTIAILLFGCLLVGGILYYLGSSEYADRLQALTAGARKGDLGATGDTSLYNRVLLYKKAFELALSHPLLGVGLDVFRTAGIQFRQIGNNSHSNYMEILASTGLIGAPIYFAMYYFWWRRLWRSRVALSNVELASRFAIAVAVAAQMLVFDLAWVTYYEKLTWLVLSGLIVESHLISRSLRFGHT